MTTQWCEFCRQDCPVGCMGDERFNPKEVTEATDELLETMRTLQETYISGEKDKVEPLARKMYDLSDATESFQAYMARLDALSTVMTTLKLPEPAILSGIPSIDDNEEHTPSKEEWAAMRKNTKFKSFVSKIGGIASPRRIECGTGSLSRNLRDALLFVQSNPGSSLRFGWMILVGKPTIFNFNAHFWVELECGKHIAVSREVGETHFLVAEPKEDFAKFMFNRFQHENSICKSVVLNPVCNQQTADEFVDTAGTIRSTIRVPIPARFAHLYAEEEQEEKC